MQLHISWVVSRSFDIALSIIVYVYKFLMKYSNLVLWMFDNHQKKWQKVHKKSIDFLPWGEKGIFFWALFLRLLLANLSLRRIFLIAFFSWVYVTPFFGDRLHKEEVQFFALMKIAYDRRRVRIFSTIIQICSVFHGKSCQ